MYAMSPASRPSICRPTARTLDLIRRETDIVIQGSTGGKSDLSLAERCVSINEPRTQVASLNMGSVNFGEGVYINTLPDIRFWIGEMRKHGVVPELEIFDVSMLASIDRLVDEGLLAQPLNYNFCLGFHGAMLADPRHLYYLSSLLPPGSHWGFIHEGMRDYRMLAAALGLGARAVRVGFEDGRHLAPDRVAPSNVELVKRLADLVRPARLRDRHARRGARPTGRLEELTLYRIETEDLGRKVYKVLKSMIINGDLQSGEKLVQEELAERLGVSRTPLLSAFSKLEQENLVETLPASRRLRAPLQPQGAASTSTTSAAGWSRWRRATPRPTSRRSRSRALRGCSTPSTRPPAAATRSAQKRTDYDFHMEVLRCCGNRFLFDMLATHHHHHDRNTNGLLKPAERSSGAPRADGRPRRARSGARRPASCSSTWTGGDEPLSRAVRPGRDRG